MSDIESFRSASPTRHIIDNASHTDEVLNDHRNQASSLPIRSSAGEEDSRSAELLHVQPRSQYMGNLRRDFYLNQSVVEDDEGPETPLVPYVKGSGGSLAAAARRGRRRSRSRSFSEQIKALVNPRDVEGSGVLLKQPVSNSKKYKMRQPSTIDAQEADIVSPMTKTKTNDTVGSDTPIAKRDRRASRSSIDSEADSHASRSSQETEEDVCFPMLREHVRIKGIDFDEIEEFIKQEHEQQQLMIDQHKMIADRTAMRVNTHASAKTTGSSKLAKPSNVALKYTPKKILTRFTTRYDPNEGFERKPEIRSDSSTANEDFDDKNSPNHFDNAIADDSSSSDNVRFGGARINDSASVLPDRFSFFSSESEETIHAPDIPSLVEPGQSVREIFKNGEGTWWLDCVCPTDAEMKMLAKAFGIHPLTAEDIRMQETREKVELFKSYYFVCFHTFEPDKESEDYLEPINVYIVVFRDGILSFHFSPILHPANVRRRVRQLRDYVDVSSDWLCYALIDDITDGFAPVITGIEYEADAIEDSVFVARELDFGNMLQRIGEARKKVMTLMRLLSGKADVIKMFAKRCQDEALNQSNVNQNQSNVNFNNLGGSTSGNATPVPNSFGGMNPISFGPGPGAPSNVLNSQLQYHGRAQPRADIALYLGDIQDHVVTMFQNLLAYEKILSRSHSNYLAQLQVESFNSNNKVTEMLSKVTIIGTMLVPLNLVTGLFGMNVRVPGQDDGSSGFQWFFGILGVMAFIVCCSFLLARIWLRSVNASGGSAAPASSKRSIKSFGLKTRTREAAKSIISFPNKYE